MIRADGRCENDDLAAANRVGGIGVSGINRSLASRTLENRCAIAADDSSGKPVLLQSQGERSANQAGADDRDLANGHRLVISPDSHADDMLT